MSGYLTAQNVSITLSQLLLTTKLNFSTVMKLTQLISIQFLQLNTRTVNRLSMSMLSPDC